ncbi:MAG: ATP-binding protein [Phycisphaerales bacterium]
MHPVLMRQLKRLGLNEGSGCPDAAAWASLVSVISRTYEQCDLDRSLLERSQEISNTEMQELHLRLEQQNANLEAEVAQRTSQLSEALDRAESASAAKSTFMAKVSHEIRTPMNGVIGATDLLLKSGLDDRQRKFVSIIRHSGESLMTIINDILDFSKIEAGKLQLADAAIDPIRLLHDAVDLLRPLANKKGIFLRLHTPAEEGHRVRGDGDRLRQVALNMIGNAIKFTDKGGVTVKLVMTPRDTGATECRLEVSDTGCGISEADQKKLFQSFSQVDQSSTRKHGGTGLGLVICKQLIEMMGGGVGVSSELGKGSTFSFAVVLPNAKAETERAAPPRDGAGEREARRLRVLVAEDNEINQIVVGELLNERGLRCEIVSNGRDAVERAVSGEFDVVLMDCQMPEMDGFEATRRIRAIERERRVERSLPIIALTANAVKGDAERCLAAGMTAYQSKPIDPMKLFEAIDALGGSHRAASPESSTVETPPRQ